MHHDTLMSGSLGIAERTPARIMSIARRERYSESEFGEAPSYTINGYGMMMIHTPLIHPQHLISLAYWHVVVDQCHGGVRRVLWLHGPSLLCSTGRSTMTNFDLVNFIV